MKIRLCVEVFLYLSLLGGSMLFVRENIMGYLEGKTAYSVRQSPITISDLPTVIGVLDQKRHKFSV